MPGGAATTAGIAWIGGIAVMMWPSPMKSSMVLAFSTKSGGGGDLPGVAFDFPIWVERLPLAPPHVEVDDGLAADSALPAGEDARHTAGLDGPRGHFDVRGGLRVLRLTDNLVELDTQGVGDQPHRLCEHCRALRSHRLQVGIVDGLAEAAGGLGVG